ncbi:MAG TPA: high-affinity branched-chain amino acid ABC transporter permease LivM [Candidatus Cybelea sp.]|nr:high-affinity branched-chain amino acid ABC transporter permease LivM [Candidatus Cybelea sp.]
MARIAARTVAGLRDAAFAAGVTAALALPLIGLHLDDVSGGVVIRYRFGSMALAMAAVFCGRLAMTALRAGDAGWFRTFGARLAPRVRLGRGRIGFGVAFLALVLPLIPGVENQTLDRGILVLIYVMLGWGLNVVVGLAGLLDLGYVAFYAVGAYSYALLAAYLGFTFWICLPLAALLAATFGVVLGFPVLRLRGDYLAIVTLGFGEMIRIVLINWTSFTGGPNGLSQIPRPTLFGLEFTADATPGHTTFAEFFGLAYSSHYRYVFLYYLVLAVALAVNAFTLRLRKLPLGRAWEALREDEIASRTLGINPTTVKLSAFGIGASLAGFAGPFFDARQAFVSPESFNFLESATILAIVVLGGMGSQIGVVVATFILILLPEVLRDFGFVQQIAELRLLIFGAAMVLIMIWRPQGLLSRREPSVRLDKARSTP